MSSGKGRGDAYIMASSWAVINAYFPYNINIVYYYKSFYIVNRENRKTRLGTDKTNVEKPRWMASAGRRQMERGRVYVEGQRVQVQDCGL